MNEQHVYIALGILFSVAIIALLASFSRHEKRVKSMLKDEDLYNLLYNHVRQVIQIWIKANVAKIEPSEYASMPQLIASVLRRIADEYYKETPSRGSP